jgi:hypothetical protein
MEANTQLVVEMSSVIKVFRQPRSTLEAVCEGYQESALQGNSYLFVMPRAETAGADENSARP